MSTLQADPEDRIAAPAGRAGMMARLLGPLARLRRRKKTAPHDDAADHGPDHGAAGLDGGEDQVGEDRPGEDRAGDFAGQDAGGQDYEPRRMGFKHKLLGVLYLLGLVLWPPFLRGNLSTLGRRLLAPAWLLLLLALIGGGGYIAVTGQSLTVLPGSEVVIGVSKLALPPEAKLEGDQKRAEQAQKTVEGIGRYPSGLLMAPDPALVESSAIGQMPKIGSDGRQPWRAYARPYDEPADRPRMAIVLTNLGLNESLTAKAAELLPPAITFAFNPYAPNLRAQIENARMLGHEVLLQLPMEPFDYPMSDPGPNTLLTSLTEQENLRRLDWLLSRAPGYVGFTNLMGAKFTSSPEHMRFLAQQLKQRGLMFVDARTAPRSVGARLVQENGGVYAIGNRWIDQQPTGPVIESRLDELERLARGGGVAVGFATPYPITLDRLVQWSKSLAGKSFALAPVSALVNRQPLE
ncbi:divergent polysaccharide deacetylase family protein [Ferrovibrio sp.]|uniref:divergent polysaccharide deacetylase family protein n=1 Tax=Ferrovibrio sp. TaxID=1917215 RepID=UPI0025B7CB8B|nr:divergent polysaccharide deacetylase family protein [Ferrovibrio sp.]MBX3453845.1 divergent polysaccharide deacetylase family protein [Ferrovibrio sp.]